MNSKIKTTRFYLLILFVGGLFQPGITQQNTVENSILWEVSGNGLAKPSYLFGTFHLMGNLYADSLTNVMDKLSQSEMVVGEMIIDSAMVMKMTPAMQLNGTTLTKLLTPEDFTRASDWVKELSGYDLKMFNTLNPMSVHLLIVSFMQKKYYPMDPAKDIPMDVYFQNFANKNGKKLVGLESLEDQIHALFGQFTYERQAEILADFVSNKDKAYQEIVVMNKLYRQQNLEELEKLMTSSASYDTVESEVMLDNRNKNWMKQLPDLFQNNKAFVAVGAMHLAGKNGLVNLLRSNGYSVRPLKVK